MGLGLFVLFPLLSVLQLGGSDDVWDPVVRRLRPRVVALYGIPKAEASLRVPDRCGVVVQTQPLRLGVTGRVIDPLTSDTPGGWIVWDPVHVAENGSFSILESRTPLDRARMPEIVVRGLESRRHEFHSASIGGGAQIDPAPTQVALVSPAVLCNDWVWVAHLLVAPASTTYPIRAFRSLEAASPCTGPPRSGAAWPLDTLRGAPFVTRDGSIVALYAGPRDDAPIAVPMTQIFQALARVDLQHTPS